LGYDISQNSINEKGTTFAEAKVQRDEYLKSLMNDIQKGKKDGMDYGVFGHAVMEGFKYAQEDEGKIEDVKDMVFRAIIDFLYAAFDTTKYTTGSMLEIISTLNSTTQKYFFDSLRKINVEGKDIKTLINEIDEKAPLVSRILHTALIMKTPAAIHAREIKNKKDTPASDIDIEGEVQYHTIITGMLAEFGQTENFTLYPDDSGIERIVMNLAASDKKIDYSTLGQSIAFNFGDPHVCSGKNSALIYMYLFILKLAHKGVNFIETTNKGHMDSTNPETALSDRKLKVH
jgi:hypothetical protein